MKITLILLSVIGVLSSFGDGYKILGVFPTMARSHYIVGSALMKELARRGHEVTVINPFPQKTPLKNYRDIVNLGILEDTKGLMSNILDMRNQNIAETFGAIFDMGLLITNSTLRDSNVQQLIRSKEKYDLVIMEMFLNEAMLGFGHLFNAPVIGISTFGASFLTTEAVGSPSPPSYVPNPFLSLTDRMNLFERMQNICVEIMQNIFNTFYYFPKQEALYEAAFPDPKPSLKELHRNVAFILLNTHVSVSYPRPYVPNMVEVGGMHVNRKSNPLPDNIKKFIESAKDGVIYFSMGSNVKGNQLPLEKREAILKVFGSLKQKVLWKFEDTNMPGKSDNIMISDWFPQDDILAHPNVKLFITHGGLLSTTEAIYHGVPVIGIPIFGDQHLNMGNAVKSGYGLLVNYNEISEDVLKKTIIESLQNPKYRDNMKKISERYRDQPQPPLEKAVYWVEYVLRHKGARHLHSAGMDLSFIQYHNIDAFGIIFGVIFLIIYMIIKLFRSLCSSGGGEKSKVVPKKKKTS